MTVDTLGHDPTMYCTPAMKDAAIDELLALAGEWLRLAYRRDSWRQWPQCRLCGLLLGDHPGDSPCLCPRTAYAVERCQVIRKAASL